MEQQDEYDIELEVPPAPPARVPRPVTEVPTVLGRRVELVSYDEETGVPLYVPDHRAASEVYLDTLDNRRYINVVIEADWYAWQADSRPDKPPRCP